MRTSVPILVALLFAVDSADAGVCYGESACSYPCPAADSCYPEHPDPAFHCPAGLTCQPACQPSTCVCGQSTGNWNCTDDCAWECRPRFVASGPWLYDIIDLGTLGGPISFARGINDQGQVVGGADITLEIRHAFLWENGTMTDLGTLGLFQTTEYDAYDINNAGQVVGWPGWVWQDGQMTRVGDSEVFADNAYGINDAGKIVGAAAFPGFGTRAFLYQEGTMTNLATWGCTAGYAYAINETDQIAATRCLYQNGTSITLPSLGGTNWGTGDNNDLGQAVGESYRTGDTVYHACLWEPDGTITELFASENLRSSTAEAINNNGHIVGRATRQGDIWSIAYLYEPGLGLLNLKDIMRPYSQWEDLSPMDINNRGDIVGVGMNLGARHAFLMTRRPPEPTIPAASTWTLGCMTALFVGCAAMIVRSRRSGPTPPRTS